MKGFRWMNKYHIVFSFYTFKIKNHGTARLLSKWTVLFDKSNTIFLPQRGMQVGQFLLAGIFSPENFEPSFDEKQLSSTFRALIMTLVCLIFKLSKFKLTFHSYVSRIY